jgi:hypothetical protein
MDVGSKKLVAIRKQLRQLRARLAAMPGGRFDHDKVKVRDEVERLLLDEDRELNRLWPDKYPCAALACPSVSPLRQSLGV